MDGGVGLQEEDVETSWTLLSWLASCLMVFGGALPYVPQYQEIQRSSNTEGFSTRVCLVLLIANILRIFFWIGKQFELTLLLQSVVMILTMFAMLHLCCTVQSTNRVSTKQHRLSGNVPPIDCTNTCSINASSQLLPKEGAIVEDFLLLSGLT
ncbi:solute carrier family 66 member 2-like [Boleophthalmus pectinirostris]|uniref:solute carrier family 66 member 2-like n=1 Tax=Boleophthalmus pectinirostris TaxID=150288 RepID=UPI002430FBE3|nr:solute carrier family 66 member 2-like [Boleophthalmus pectinirostris]